MCAPEGDNSSGNGRATETMSNVDREGTSPSRGIENSKSQPLNDSRRNRFPIRRSHSISEASSHMTAGTLLSLLFVVLASYLPFFLAPHAAEATYQLASFEYLEDISHFDNSVWTFGTDYFLALVMGLLIASFPSTKSLQKKTSCSHVHTFRSQAMLWCYLLSVLAGGLAHQFYTTIESRGHWSFRLLWTICVGTVTAAPAFMGSVGTELNHFNDETESEDSKPIRFPGIPAWFWAAYAVCSTMIVAFGGMSYQRPACDIFMAGVTQSPSTFYVMTILGLGLRHHPIPKWTRLVGAIGFILNAPLLPLYPLLVQYTDWSLAAVNTLLHTWLLVAWSMQGICLRRVAIALDEYDASASSPPSSVSAQDKKTT